MVTWHKRLGRVKKNYVVFLERAKHTNMHLIGHGFQFVSIFDLLNTVQSSSLQVHAQKKVQRRFFFSSSFPDSLHVEPSNPTLVTWFFGSGLSAVEISQFTWCLQGFKMISGRFLSFCFVQI